MKNKILQTETSNQTKPFNYQSWVDFISQKNDIKINVDTTIEYTAMINLEDVEKPVITINPVLMKEKYDYSEEEIILDLGHEIGHRKEQSELEATQAGKKVSVQRIKRFENREQQRAGSSKSYHVLENILRDVWVNNDLVKPQNMPVLKPILKSNYRDKMFKDKDYTQLPKHLQLIYTIIRENMVEDEKCTIDFKVRRIIKRLERNGAIELSVEGNLKSRLKSMREYIEPIYEKLLEQDIKEQKQQQEGKGEQQEGKGEQQEGKGEQQEGKGEQQEGKGEQQEGKTIKEKLKDLLGGKKKPEEKSKSPNNKDGDPEPKNSFDDLYDEIPEIPHILEDNLSEEDIKSLKDKLQQIAQERAKIKSKEELELENRLQNMGLDPKNKENFEKTKRELQKYDNFLQQLEKVKDPETGNSVIDEIRNLFKLIRSKRLKPRYQSKGPVDIEHGVRLHGPSIASGIADIKSGNYEPDMFEMDIPKEKEKQYVGKVDISILFDGTASMGGTKNKQQKIAGHLIFEGLKGLHDELELDSHNLTKGLEITNEGYIFGRRSRKIKKQSTDFSDQERLDMYKALDEDDGPDNNEGLLLESIYKDFHKNTSDDYKEEIELGKTKKIIIVLTDGGQNVAEYKKKLLANIKSFRADGVLVYGIGITSGGSSVISIYGSEDEKLGFGKICKDPKDLAKVLKDLLQYHLERV